MYFTPNYLLYEFLYFNDGYNVIVDDTNFEDKHYHSIYNLVRHLIKEGKVVIEFKDFDITLEEALMRNSLRDKKVPDDVIISMHKKYIDSKSKDEISKVLNQDTFAQKYVWQDLELPRAILVDIDGTLAIRKDRGPFEWFKVGQDDLNEPVADIVKKYSGTHKIIFMSGRDEVCRDLTIDWIITKLGLIHFDLLMRPENDNRKDCTVKKELYEKHIEGNYYVDFVLDDRDSVVNLYRNDIGLLVLQVAYGNF